MSYNLWLAKNLTRRIEKYRDYVKKVSEWINRDKKEINKLLKKLTKEENLKYGYQMGFIEKVDYEVMKTTIDMITPYFKPKVKIWELFKRGRYKKKDKIRRNRTEDGKYA